MKLIILGSGGGTEIPRPFCQCRVCQEARQKGIPYARNALAVYIEEIKALLETPEDISDSLTRENIQDVDYIFLSHWHPDHTFGLRTVVQAYYDWNKGRARKYLDLYISEAAYQKLTEIFGAIKHFENVQGLRVRTMDSNRPVEVKGCRITFVPTEREDIGGFLFECENKKLAFAPCDVKNIEEARLRDLDLLIHELGWFSNDPQGNVLIDDFELWSSEMRFEETIERIKRLKPKRTVLIGLEEVYQRSFEDYQRLEKKYGELNLKFAYDGMKIEL
jgi:phosphoribosyl 1,2-cyclic phosphate phosphodiesterase